MNRIEPIEMDDSLTLGASPQDIRDWGRRQAEAMQAEIDRRHPRPFVVETRKRRPK